MLKKILILFILYTYLFRLELVIYPVSVAVLYGMLGFLLFLFTAGYRTKVSKLYPSGFPNYLNFIKLGTPILIVALLTGFVNFNSDWYFVKYFFSIVLTYFFSYAVTFLFYRTYGEITVEKILKYIIICNFIYLGLSLIMLVIPSIGSLLFSLMKFDEAQEAALIKSEGVRLHAFGISYFNGGVIQGFICLFLALYVSFIEKSKHKQYFIICCMCVFALMGLFIARTSMVGSGLGFLVLAIFYIRKHLKTFISILSIVGILVMIVLHSDIPFLKQYEDMFNWAFELFINYGESGEATTTSLYYMTAMYDIIPDNIKTWIIGDARWLGVNGEGFYMGTDIGMFRYIWYFGIIGLIVMLSYNYKYLKLFFCGRLLNNNSRFFIVFLFLYLTILLFKGAADLLYLCSLFYFCSSLYTNKIRKSV